MENNSQTQTTFHKRLKHLLDNFVDQVYYVSKKFPKDELFGVTSQLRRAALSVVLNYVEGYARQGDAVLRNFLKIAYGSLKESEYLIEFCYRQKYVGETDFKELAQKANEIGAMLYSIISKLS